MDESTLTERVHQFNTLSLPGQPMSMHMGTSYLVHALWQEVQRLETILNNQNTAKKEVSLNENKEIK